MKLRVRINRQTSRVELLGEDPSLKELIDHIKENILCSHGLSAESEFSVSLNGSELLSDAGQTLSSCGIVSGDLISVILPESVAAGADHAENQREEQNQQNAAMASNQPSSSGGGGGGGSSGGGGSTAALTELEETPDMLNCEPSASSWEPMLCSEAEDGEAPLALELLYHLAQVTSPSEAVVVAGNRLMLETGFIPQCVCCACVPGCELNTSEMPAGWRSAGGVYKLQYTHPLCDRSLVTVVTVCMGPVLVINAVLKVNQTVETVRKLCLNPASYVTDEWPGDGAAAAFKDLKKLSRIFKDQLAYPLIAAARAAMALPVAFGLAALPPELLLRVLRLLDVTSVVRLSSVCRHFNVATADSTLWRHLFRRDFTDSDPNRPRDTDWKELYKRFYKIRYDLRRARHHSLPPFLRHPRDIFQPAPLHPPLPGIIGGEYDQRPNLPHGLFPRPRHDPIGPHRDHDRRPVTDSRRFRPMGGRPADVRRGFI
ncbi:F-box only protein 7 [Acanthopagrus latus]|uniref:F-box only protein 7 n=1 Tax=Acanthopagrus latus TaxID=8177 RepID=UPI00187C0E5F|nr:F-box only protein 7 [Acanthopagrus latus]